MEVSSISSSGNWARSSASAPAEKLAERRPLIHAAKLVNQSGALGKNQLVISVDSATHRPVIRIEDRETHEVVLQVPPEYVLRLAENLRGDSRETIPGEADT